MYQLVGDSEIADGIVVLMAVEIVVVIAERLTQSVTVVQHGCDAVETESVEMEFLEPILAVAQQEVDNLILAIVEAEAVPCRMLMLFSGIEILVGVSCQIAKTFHLVLHRMTVNDVHDDGHTLTMSLVDERFQFFGSAKSARSSKETAHMIAE